MPRPTGEPITVLAELTTATKAVEAAYFLLPIPGHAANDKARTKSFIPYFIGRMVKLLRGSDHRLAA